MAKIKIGDILPNGAEVLAVKPHRILKDSVIILCKFNGAYVNWAAISDKNDSTVGERNYGNDLGAAINSFTKR